MAKKFGLTPAQTRRFERLKRMTPAEYDAICKRCGICCLHKIKGPCGTVLFLNAACQHFDTQTKTCTIYETRLSDCCDGKCAKVTPEMAAEAKQVPASCGYAEYIYGPAPYPASVDFKRVVKMSDEERDFFLSVDARRIIIPQSALWGLHRTK